MIDVYEKQAHIADVCLLCVKKFLMKLFSKSFRRQGRGALVARRNARNKASAFLFVNFFFAPPISKEKVAMDFMLINGLFIHQKLSADFFF